MAEQEQFALRWNDFSSNLSSGFHEVLCQGDLLDVTLAVNGELIKAHRLVLSVCSPYFRKMFSRMPANQHAFVFLKDVSASTLKDLIQFMYCGEVSVEQGNLATFLSTAEALSLKGLAGETGELLVDKTRPSTPKPSTSNSIKRAAPISVYPTTSKRSKNIPDLPENSFDSFETKTDQDLFETTEFINLKTEPESEKNVIEIEEESYNDYVQESISNEDIQYTYSNRGHPVLIYKEFGYIKRNRTFKRKGEFNYRWVCRFNKPTKCRASLHQNIESLKIREVNVEHNHDKDYKQRLDKNFQRLQAMKKAQKMKEASRDDGSSSDSSKS